MKLSVRLIEDIAIVALGVILMAAKYNKDFANALFAQIEQANPALMVPFLILLGAWFIRYMLTRKRWV